jgi:flagellar biogenesis protein FliO
LGLAALFPRLVSAGEERAVEPEKIEPARNAPPRDQVLLQEEKKLIGAAPTGATSAAKEKSAPGISPWIAFAKLVGYLFVLSLILWGGLYGMKKYMPGGKQLFACPGMELLGRTHLDQRRYLALVKVGARVLVVGVSPDSLSPLAEIADGEEVKRITEECASRKMVAANNLFQRLFTREADKQENAANAVEMEKAGEELATELHDLRQRVKSLRASE